MLYVYAYAYAVMYAVASRILTETSATTILALSIGDNI